MAAMYLSAWYDSEIANLPPIENHMCQRFVLVCIAYLANATALGWVMSKIHIIESWA